MEMQQSLSQDEMRATMGDPAAARRVAALERERGAFVAAAGLVTSDGGTKAESTERSRNLARLRLAERGGVAPRTAGVRLPPTRCKDVRVTAYSQRRYDDPVYRKAVEGFEEMLTFEYGGDPKFREAVIAKAPDEAEKERVRKGFKDANAESAIRGLTFAVCNDSSALCYSGPQDEATGRVSMREAYPRTVAALEKAAAATPPSPPPPEAAAATAAEALSPYLGADALCCLASLALVDPSIGDSLQLMNKALSPRHRAHLSYEACAVFTRCCYLAMRSRLDCALEDCLEACEIANQIATGSTTGRHSGKGDPGLLWSFQVATAKALSASGKPAEALERFQQAVDAAHAAVAERETDPSASPSPLTGGRERDPYKFAKVVDAEYCIAHMLLEGGSKPGVPGMFGGPPLSSASTLSPREMLRKGRKRYAAAAAREALLPEEALVAMPGDRKLLCQAVLSSLPATTRTQAAVNAGMPAGRNALECTGCGRTDYGGKLRACSACKKAAYCSQACQKEHWKVHKPACKQASSKKKK